MASRLAALSASLAAAAAATSPAAAAAAGVLSAPLTCGGAAGPAYSVTLDGAPLFSAPPPLAVYMGGGWVRGGWVLLRAANVSGADGLGPYVGTECAYGLAGSPGPVVTTAAYTYAAPAAAAGGATAVRFAVSYPGGATGTAHAAGKPATFSTVANFPAFAGPGTPLKNVLTWRDAFFGPSNSVADSLGQLSSALLFYGADVAAPAVVLSPLDHFLNAALGDDLATAAPSACSGSDAGCWVAGASATLTALPPGFSQSFVLVAAPGVTGAMDAWGRLLRAYYGGTAARLTDTSLTTLGYQTDNGAQLCFGCSGPLDACLLAEKAYLDSLHVPIRYLSFQNAWWQSGGESAPWCVGEWVPTSHKVPMGMQAFQQALGLPLQLVRTGRGGWVGGRMKEVG